MIITANRLELKRDQKLVIIPIGDIHHNAPSHDAAKLREIIQWAAASAKRPDRLIRVKLMGDELDTMSASERRSHTSASYHESTRLRFEKMIFADLMNFYRELTPIHHLIDTVVCGNHTYRFQEQGTGKLVGKTTSEVLAERLNVPFLGVCGVHVYELHPPGSTGTFPFKILMHHGFGAAQTKPASIRQMLSLRERFPNMDLYIMGHNHVKITTTTEGIDVRRDHRNNKWRMVERQQAFVRSGSFLKGYVEGEVVAAGQGSYVEEHCYAPAGLGVTTCNLRWRLNESGRLTGFKLHVQE